MKRDPKSLLWDACEAANAIAAMTAGKTFEDFDQIDVSPEQRLERFLKAEKGLQRQRVGGAEIEFDEEIEVRFRSE